MEIFKIIEVFKVHKDAEQYQSFLIINPKDTCDFCVY